MEPGPKTLQHLVASLRRAVIRTELRRAPRRDRGPYTAGRP